MTIRRLSEGIVNRIAAVSLVLWSAPPAWALDTDPKLVRQEACMLDILKKAPNVKILAAKAPPEQMTVGTFYNFVDYRSQGWGVRVQVSKESDSDYQYKTIVSGLGADPEAHGTNAINQSWKAACGAATIFFFP